MEQQRRMLKIVFNSQIKMCALTESFETLKKTVQKAFDIKDSDNMLFSYEDDEKDSVQISSEYDFSQMIAYLNLRNLKTLKIRIDAVENALNKFEASEIDLEKVESSFFELIEKKNLELMDSQKVNEKQFEIIASVEPELKHYEQNKLEKTEKVLKEKKPKAAKKKSEDKAEKEKSKKPLKLKIKQNLCVEDNMIANDHKVIANLEKPKKKIIKKILKPKAEKKPISEQDEVEILKMKAIKNIKKSVKLELSKIEKSIVSSAVDQSNQMIDHYYTQMTNYKPIDSSSISNRTVNNAVHSTVRCDGCNVHPLVGSRYKCSVCNDFDFCESCESKNTTHNHAFIKIRKPELAPTKIEVVIRDDEPEQKEVDIIENFNNKINYYVNKGIENFKTIDMNFGQIEKNFLNLFGVKTNNQSNSQPALNSQFLTENREIFAVNNNIEIKKVLKIKNTGSTSWPRPCYLACDSNSQIIGQSVPIKVKVEANKDIQVEITLNLKDLKDGKYLSVWTLQNEKRQAFGAKIELTLIKETTNDLEIKAEETNQNKANQTKAMSTKDFFNKFIKNRKTEAVKEDIKEEVKVELKGIAFYKSLLEEVKTKELAKDSTDAEILAALIATKGNVEIAINNLKSKNYKQVISRHNH